MSNRLTHAPRTIRLFRRTLVAIALASMLVLLPLASVFAVNLNTVNTAVTQNFDTMTPNSATATLPTDFKVDKFATAVRTLGTYAAAGTATDQTGSQLT